MTAKEYLSQAHHLDQRIDAKIAQVASLNELATKCTATLTGMPRNPNRGGSTMADAVCKIIDLQEEINRDIDRLVDLKREIVEVIKSVTTPSTRFFWRNGICASTPGSRLLWICTTAGNGYRNCTTAPWMW